LEDDEGLRVELSGDECQVRNVQLFRAHRNTVAGGLLFDAALSFARSRGLRRNVGSVDCRNVPSLRIAHHIGYLEVERVTCRRLLYHLRWRRVVWRAASREEGREITWDSANPPLSRRARARGGLRRRDGR
jgi:GNAT superfamily N-acetyltransferase